MDLKTQARFSSLCASQSQSATRWPPACAVRHGLPRGTDRTVGGMCSALESAGKWEGRTSPETITLPWRPRNLLPEEVPFPGSAGPAAPYRGQPDPSRAVAGQGARGCAALASLAHGGIGMAHSSI